MAMSSIRPGLILAGLAALGLSGCAISSPAHDSPLALPTEQFQTPVVTAEREVALTPWAEGPSARQRDVIVQVVADWRDGAAGPLVLRTPAEGGGAVLDAADRIEDFMRGLGLDRRDIVRTAYQAGPGPQTIRLGFLAQTVEIPRCGLVQKSYTDTFENKVSPNFGCAVTANIGVMAAYPRDLRGPRPEDSADAGRRQQVLERYRAGEVTSSARDEQANGHISNAVD